MKICVLGSTGSIGTQVLDVIAQHKDMFRVTALTANNNAELLLSQCLTFQPDIAVCVNEESAMLLRQRLKEKQCRTEVLFGEHALVDVAKDHHSDTVVAGIVGSAGLPATFAAVTAGKRVLLANKEALVMAGHIFMDAVTTYGALLLPIDSEHNALFQCMPSGYLPGHGYPNGVERIILTASGGPFLHRDLSSFADITPEQAVKHPNWAMGAKISVDSATMMNKGLEMIEAHWLFEVPSHQIDVIIHPQSTIHSFLSYQDGSVLAQCGVADMRIPIAHCLAWPERIATNVKRLNLWEVGHFDFEAVDEERFPCLRYAYQALESGSVAPIILNIANEVAVEAFLTKKISYLHISELVETMLSQLSYPKPEGLEDVISIDQDVRRIMASHIEMK